MSVESRLKELGIELPPPPKPMGNYVPGVLTDNLLFMSGCGPRRNDGTAITGKVGRELTTEQGYEAARVVGLNMLANIRAVLGSLDRIERVVRVTGYVNADPDFTDCHLVINGATNLLKEVFGVEAGRHARTALGMGQLPLGTSVEVEAIFQLRK